MTWTEELAAAGVMVPRGDERLRVMLRLIAERYAEPLTAKSIAAAAGASERLAYILFRREVGQTMVNVLRAVRLHHARALFLAGGGRESLVSVWRQVGAGHLGRFAGYYQDRYGEPATETILRVLHDAANDEVSVSAEAVAAELQVSTRHVYRLAEQGRIPSQRLGHLRVFNLEAVLEAARSPRVVDPADAPVRERLRQAGAARRAASAELRAAVVDARAAGMSSRVIAAEAGVSTTTVTQWGKGRTRRTR